jgi:hypothetical protein
MSTSCVARSTVTPTSRIRAGNGPARREAIAYTADSQPSPMSRPSSRTAGLKRSTWPTWTGTPARRAADTIAIPSSTVAASGFSTRTAVPRSIAARASGTWALVGAATTIASSSASAIIASGSANPWAPHWAVALATASASGSATATRRISERPARIRRWLRPIDPRPARPTRSGRSPAGRQAAVIGRRHRLGKQFRRPRRCRQCPHAAGPSFGAPRSPGAARRR